MKTNLFRCVILSLLVSSALRAADDPRAAAVRAADDERTAAFSAADKDKLAAILSDDLRYCHSNGGVDTKASMTDALTSGKTKYKSFEYEERNVTFPAPTIALMSGRVKIKVAAAAGDLDLTLAYLAVWREENGKWRFLAWQSCKLPPPVAK
jgi:hypothetical protein